MKLPPEHFKQLHSLISDYNAVPKEDPIQKIFCLQKINYVLNETNLDLKLFMWLNDSEDNSWQKHLLAYSINPNSSFFLQGMQFAGAVAKQIKDKIEANITPTRQKDQYPEFPLLQMRDNFLAKNTYATCKEQYQSLCYQLNELAHNFPRIKEKIAEHTAILALVQEKIDAIQNKNITSSGPKSKIYATERLNAGGNNANFTFTVAGHNERFILSVEDRPNLGVEQRLHSYPVAQYFTNEYSHFMMKFKHNKSSIIFKPVVLSQFANQADLTKIAQQLKTKPKSIASKTKFIFRQLSDYCLKLMEAGAYDPDIKGTNFLGHNYQLRKADRKTLITNENPQVTAFRTTQYYAPKDATDQFNPNPINMPQLMAYQLGIALKEFLILTQIDTTTHHLKEAYPSAASYFNSPQNEIINLSLLVQELTREDAKKRMSIEHFHRLLKFYTLTPDNFYQEVEKEFPSSGLGIQTDLDALTLLLESNLKGMELITKANLIFNKIAASDPQEPRLVRMAEKLALKCTKEYPHVLAQYSDSIANRLLENDWNRATWYRKAIHVLTFDYFRVDSQIHAAHFNVSTQSTPVNIPEMMAYQLGMVLKEFLILDRLDELPNNFRTTEQAADSYFKSSRNEIANFSLLVQELTHEDANQRMSIEQFHNLLPYRNSSPNHFFKEMTKILPSSKLRIKEELDAINQLLESNLKGMALINKANFIFSKISAVEPKEIYLTLLAEQLATKCFKESSHSFFIEYSNSIETQLLNKDWETAKWYSKTLHWLTFGLYRVDRVTDASIIQMDSQFKDKEFQKHLPQLEFIPQNVLMDYLGETQAINFDKFRYTHVTEINKMVLKVINALSTEDNSSPKSSSPLSDPTPPEGYNSVVIHHVSPKGSIPSHNLKFFIRPQTPMDGSKTVETPRTQDVIKRTKTIESTIAQGNDAPSQTTKPKRHTVADMKWDTPGKTP